MRKHLFFAALAAAVAGPVVASDARVVDGDTIKINGVNVRLWGIDAPEKGQKCFDQAGKPWRCGLKAKAALESLINPDDLTCKQIDQDSKYGRPVSICYSRGLDLNKTMVQLGQATAYVRFSSDYLPDEQKARSLKIGMWASSTLAPAIFRKLAKKTHVDPAPDPTCPIKGNINRHGDKIAHIPGDQGYSKTTIDTGKGERWFCSTGEALAAGWQLVR